MYLRIKNRAWSIGPYPVQKLWDTGWQVGCWGKCLGITIVVHYAPTTAQQVVAPRPTTGFVPQPSVGG